MHGFTPDQETDDDRMTDELVLPPLSGRSGPSWDEGQASVFLAVLEPFAFDGSRSEIADGVTIKRITKAARARLEEVSHPFLVGPNDFVVRCDQGAGRKESVEEQARENLDRVVLALRIFQPDPVELGAIVAYQPTVAGSAHNPWWFLFGWPSRLPVVNPLRLRGRYKLTKVATAQLKNIYRGLQANLGRSAEVALRRFDLAYQRRHSEDRLIDYWVALEALISEGQQELTYKMAMRIAHFLGKSANDRVALYEGLKKAYGVRSAVVHGRGSKRQIEEAEVVSGTALRDCLRRMVLEGKTPDPQRLDELIARGIGSAS